MPDNLKNEGGNDSKADWSKELISVKNQKQSRVK